MNLIIGKQKSIAVSYLRVLALISIVTCHILQSLDSRWAWVLNMGVQIFFFISGWLYGHKEITDWPYFFVKRIKRVYVPFIIVSMSFSCIYLFILRDPSYSWRSIIAYITDTQWFIGGGKGLGHLWFITAIAICYLSTPILQGLRNKSQLMLFALLSLAIYEYVLMRYEIKVFEPLFIYSSGYFVSQCNRLKKAYVIIMALIFAAIIWKIDWLHILAYDSIQNRMLHTFGGIAISLISIYGIAKIKLKRQDPISKWLDKYSYEIYLMHHPFILGSLSLMALTQWTWINIIIILSITVFLSVLLSAVCNKNVNIIRL